MHDKSVYMIKWHTAVRGQGYYLLSSVTRDVSDSLLPTWNVRFIETKITHNISTARLVSTSNHIN